MTDPKEPTTEPDGSDEHGDRTADNSGPAHHAPETDAERWESAGRAALVSLLERHRDDLALELEDTLAAVEGGFPITADHVGRLRTATAALETTTEEALARLAEGTRPWQASARRIPDWRLAEELGLNPEVVDGIETEGERE